METKLLDSAHGWEIDSMFVLEQYWLVNKRNAVRITVQYSIHSADYSMAELVQMEDEACTFEALLRLRAFPSQWWQHIDIKPGVPAAPEQLTAVADGLLKRYVAMAEATRL